MNNEPSRSIPSQVILGVIAICFGVLFLLDNLDIFDIERMRAFWPIILVVFGAIKLRDTKSPGGVLVGAALIVIGSMLTLKRLGFLYVDLRTLWPLVVIFLGCAVVYRAVTGRRLIEAPMKAEEGSAATMKSDDASDSVVDITAILGGFDRRITSASFRGGEVTTVMGGCMLDLRNSSIEGEAVVNVFALMGGITFKVPPDWTVVLHGVPILGGFDEKTSTPPNDAKRLIIKGYAIMGGVEVRN